VLLEEFNFRREVLDDPGPVLVDFWAEWCGPCRAMSPVLHALARDFKVCKVNTDTNPNLAAKFGVSAIPLLLIFQNGKVVLPTRGRHRRDHPAGRTDRAVQLTGPGRLSYPSSATIASGGGTGHRAHFGRLSMHGTRIFFGGVFVAAAATVAAVHPTEVRADPPAATPWGVSSSASAFRNHAEWFPKVAEAGVTSVRLFPEWRGVEPKKGMWKWDDPDALVRAADQNKLEITAILMGSPPGAKAVHAFPMDDLDGWSGFVSAAVGRYGKQIRYWEVWNEGNGGFNDGKHTTADYAKLAAVTYSAAKKADPLARVGLTVASFDAPYLDQTIRAMAKAGQPNSFDYLCIHPYEIADGLAEVDGEIPYLWMTRLTRDMLKDCAPDRANADIWITEVGRRIEKQKGRNVTEEDAAKGLAKIYTMALAQGISRVQWFEAQDPIGEDQGFGLLARNGTPRESYKTLKRLTSLLGSTPAYQGWMTLGRDGRGYGFVFAGKTAPVLVAWMPRGLTDKTISFPGDVEVIDACGGVTRSLKAQQPLELTDAPVFVTGLPAELLNQGKANAGKNFPWGGDYTSAKTVSTQPGAGVNTGIFPVGRSDRPVVKFADGSMGVLLEGDINHPISFYVHPSFAKYHTREYYVRATVRRLAAGNVGMNLLYEVADSQGRGPYANTGKWFGTTQADTWQTYTWHVTGACFSKMWGYDIVIRPEQSIPFVLGKVEVSTEPFK
jgi:thioredoxin